MHVTVEICRALIFAAFAVATLKFGFYLLYFSEENKEICGGGGCKSGSSEKHTKPQVFQHEHGNERKR
jgi:hypothetical protein